MGGGGFYRRSNFRAYSEFVRPCNEIIRSCDKVI